MNTVASAMDNIVKRSGRPTLRRMAAATTLAAAMAVSGVTGSGTAQAAAPPPENPGCATYGCLYEHCGTHYTRDGTRECRYGVAYQHLPDGPDNRRFVRVMWPGDYDPARRRMWDQVAYCESTWRWSINNGNGFHGGVQFHPTTWARYGGGEFADYAFQATAEEQIAIAERVAYYGHTRADGSTAEPQGAGAWPHCGRYLSPPA